MKCMKCDFAEESILSIIDNGVKRIVLCPNHLVGMLLGAYTFEEVEGVPGEYEGKAVCDCCNNDAIYFKDSGTEYRVCGVHAMKLAKKTLAPGEWRILSEKYGKDAFLLHSDFYDEGGNALHPME